MPEIPIELLPTECCHPTINEDNISKKLSVVEGILHDIDITLNKVRTTIIKVAEIIEVKSNDSFLCKVYRLDQLSD